MQAEAKLMAQKFNAYGPPVKIDFLKLSYIKLNERDSEPTYHLEAFVDGEYIKHNSNAGYVQDGFELSKFILLELSRTQKRQTQNREFHVGHHSASHTSVSVRITTRKLLSIYRAFKEGFEFSLIWYTTKLKN